MIASTSQYAGDLRLGGDLQCGVQSGIAADLTEAVSAIDDRRRRGPLHDPVLGAGFDRAELDVAHVLGEPQDAVGIDFQSNSPSRSRRRPTELRRQGRRAW